MFRYGGVAQLVERLTGSQEVRGFESHRLHQILRLFGFWRHFGAERGAPLPFLLALARIGLTEPAIETGPTGSDASSDPLLLCCSQGPREESSTSENPRLPALPASVLSYLSTPKGLLAETLELVLTSDAIVHDDGQTHIGIDAMRLGRIRSHPHSHSLEL
jgi:hypothetical protein